MKRLRTIPLLLLLVIAGCSALGPKDRALIQTPSAPAPAPASIRAEAVVELDFGRHIKGRAIITAKSPDLFRVEVLTPFGTPAMLLMSDGTALTVFSDKGIESYAWDDPELPYPFTSSEFVSLLLGSSPDNALYDGGGTPADNGDGTPKGHVTPVTERQRGARYNVTRDKSGFTTSIDKLKPPFRLYTASFGDYRTLDGKVLPYEISIDDGKRLLKITYIRVEKDPKIDDGLFTLKNDLN